MRPGVLVVGIGLAISLTPAHAQHSRMCEAEKLCQKLIACGDGKSIADDKLDGTEPAGRAFWHSDVFFRPMPGPIAKFQFCYYRAVHIKDAKDLLPIYWRAAGLKFHGNRGTNNTGCVVACTSSGWDEKPPKEPVKGDIEFEAQNPKIVSTHTWAPESGWSQVVAGQLKPIPLQQPLAPDMSTATVISWSDEGKLRMRLELESQVLSNGSVRYTVRNSGPVLVRVVWNIPANNSIRVIEGPFTRSGMNLDPGSSFTRDVQLASAPGDAGATPTAHQSHIAIEIEGRTIGIIALPVIAPTNGGFQINPAEFLARPVER